MTSTILNALIREEDTSQFPNMCFITHNVKSDVNLLMLMLMSDVNIIADRAHTESWFVPSVHEPKARNGQSERLQSTEWTTTLAWDVRLQHQQHQQQKLQQKLWRSSWYVTLWLVCQQSKDKKPVIYIFFYILFRHTLRGTVKWVSGCFVLSMRGSTNNATQEFYLLRCVTLRMLHTQRNATQKYAIPG